MNVYRGYRYHPGQHGEGLGNILGALFRVARPLIRSGLKAALPIAANFGSRVLGDVAEGRKLSESAKARAKEAGMDVVNKVVRHATGQRGGRLGRQKKRRAIVSRRRLVPAVRRKQKNHQRRRHIRRQPHINGGRKYQYTHPSDPFGAD